jgi:hypothetical protein
MSEDDRMFDAMGRMLHERSGWHLEPSTSPGGSPSWCLDPGGSVVLAASVIDGAVVLYLPESDEEVQLGSVDELASWLAAHPDR